MSSPTTGSTDELLSHGICMAAEIFTNKNNNNNCNNNNSNCKLIHVNRSALNGEDGEIDLVDGKLVNNNQQTERCVELGSSSSSSSNSSSSTSSGSSSSASSSSSSTTSSTSHKSLPVVIKANNVNPNHEAAWACKICNFSHKWPLIMINHLRIFHKLQSPFDQYIFKMDNGLTESSSTSTAKSIELVTYQPTSTNIKCKLCDTAFETVQDLEEHNEHLHSDLVWACRSCSFSNKWQQLAISHLRSAHNCHPPYTDHLYRKNSDKTSNLLQRIQSASIDFRSHLHSSPSKPPQQQQQQQSTANSLSETVAQTTTTTTSTISTATATSSSAQENTDSVKEEQSIDNDVTISNNNDNNGDLVNNNGNMIADGAIESPPSPGIQSGLKMATKDCYRRLDNDRFQCTNCGKTCGSAQGITEHYEAYHLGLNYQCKLCGFTDLWRSMLTKHLKVNHLMGKPYEKFLRRVKVETNLTNSNDNQMISNYRRRRSRIFKEPESPESISSPEKVRRQSSTSSTSTLAPTSSSITKRSSNVQQQQQQPQVKTTKRGRKPKDKLAIKAKTAKSKRRRS